VVRCCPSYQPSFNRFICDTKDDTFTMATLSHDNCLYKVILGWLRLQRRNKTHPQFFTKKILLSSPLRYYLGTDKQHTVYEAEGSGSINGTSLAEWINRRLNGTVIIELDSQALIKATENHVLTQVTTSSTKFTMQLRNCKQTRQAFQL